MNRIDANITLGELVNEKPGSVSLLERLRLDYCCGGAQTLAEACARRGLDQHTVCAVLEALEERALPVVVHDRALRLSADHRWR